MKLERVDALVRAHADLYHLALHVVPAFLDKRIGFAELRERAQSALHETARNIAVYDENLYSQVVAVCARKAVLEGLTPPNEGRMRFNAVGKEIFLGTNEKGEYTGFYTVSTEHTVPLRKGQVVEVLWWHDEPSHLVVRDPESGRIALLHESLVEWLNPPFHPEGKR